MQTTPKIKHGSISGYISATKLDYFTARNHCRVLLSLLAFIWADSVFASNDCDNDDASRQSISGFNSLIDGQPGTAGQPFMSLVFSHPSSELVGSYGFTPGPRIDECDALLSFTAPVLMTTNGSYSFESSFAISWEQRWHAQQEKGISFASLAGFSIPYKGDNRQIDGNIILVLVRTFKSDSAYLNLGAASTAGLNSKWSTSMTIGWKHPSKSGNSAIVADAVFAPKNVHRLELSWQSTLGASPWTIGPGVGFNVSPGPSEWSAGIVIQYTFDAKEN